MKNIKLDSYEWNDLYRILEYAKQKKTEDVNDNKITEKMYTLDIRAINNLINRINGHYKEEYLIRKP